MLQAVEAARWGAVEHLQRRICSSDPNSFEAAVAEHAIGLVLNPNRPVGAYLVQNARVDARKVVAARCRRRRQREVSLTQEREGVQPCPGIEASCVAQGHVPHCERTILWQDAYWHLRAAVAGRNRMAGPCLECWRDGREERETAAALGISLAYVKKLRRLIRDTAVRVLPEAVRA